MKKQVIKRAATVLAVIFIAWAAYVTAEGIRLIGSTDPGKYPLLYIGGEQRADVRAKYDSLGFTLDYHLTSDDTFAWGEFKVMGIPISRWPA